MANMHLVTGYAGEDHITAADQGSWNAAVVGSGEYVLKKGSQFAATVITNNQIRIADGDILMQGRHIRLNENTYVDLTIASGTQGYYRNDLIVARYTKNSSTGVEEANLVVIKGTAKTNIARDPGHTTGDIITEHALVNEMPLYRVKLDGISIAELVPLFTVVDTSLANMAAPDEMPTKGSEKPVMSGGVFSAMKSKKTTATIGTAWNGSSAPYTQTIGIIGVTADSIVEISLPSNASVSEVSQFQDLNLQDGGQAAGSITLRAFDTKNTIPIPINVIVRSDS